MKTCVEIALNKLFRGFPARQGDPKPSGLIKSLCRKYKDPDGSVYSSVVMAELQQAFGERVTFDPPISIAKNTRIGNYRLSCLAVVSLLDNGQGVLIRNNGEDADLPGHIEGFRPFESKDDSVHVRIENMLETARKLGGELICVHHDGLANEGRVWSEFSLQLPDRFKGISDR